MRRKPLHSLGHDGRRRRGGRVKIPTLKTKVTVTQNYNPETFDDEAMYNLYGFFDVLLEIDRGQKINQNLHAPQD